MIVFREKEFVAPAIALMGGPLGVGLMAGGTALSGIQGRKANKAQEEANKQMVEQQNRQAKLMLAEEKKRTEAYKESLNNGNVTPPVQSEFSITLKRKTFAKPGVQGIVGAIKSTASGAWTKFKGSKAGNKLIKLGKAGEGKVDDAWTKFKSTKTGGNLVGFGKDLIEVGKTRGSAQKIADMTAMGATMAGGSYLVDKAIQADAKKSGIPIESGQPQEKKKPGVVKKAILGTGAAAGTLLLARKGKLNAQTFKKGGKMLGEGFKNQFRLKDPNTGKKSILGPAFTIGIPALTGVSYLTKKKQMKDQIEQSERQYSKSAFVRNLGKRMGNVGKKIIDAPAALMGFGSTGREQLGGQLLDQAKNSGNSITRKMGKLVNPKNALLGTTAGIGVGLLAFKPFDLGDKAVRKPLEKVDKKAYGYEKSQNQVV